MGNQDIIIVGGGDQAPLPPHRLGSLAEQAEEATRETSQIVSHAFRTVVYIFAIATPWMLRIAITAFAIYGSANLFRNLYTKLGGEPIAAAPAATIAIMPLILSIGMWTTTGHIRRPDDAGSATSGSYVTTSGQQEHGLWGAMVASGIVTHILAIAVGVASPAMVVMAIGVVTVVCWFYIAFVFYHPEGDAGGANTRSPQEN